MQSKTERNQRDYSFAFKLAVVEQVEKRKMTYKQSKEHYGMQGRSTVLVWLRKHGRLNWCKGTPELFKRDAHENKPNTEQGLGKRARRYQDESGVF